MIINLAEPELHRRLIRVLLIVKPIEIRASELKVIGSR